jgi:competence protein ComEC
LKSSGISLAAGSCIDATGRCTTGLGRDGRSTTFEIFTAAHIQYIDPPRQWQQWLNATRHRVQEVLTAPPLSGGHINSMVSAIVLGRRDGGWNEIAAPFRGTGTAHLLAVSGLHLAVLCGIVLAGTRWCGASIRRGSAVAVVATVMMLCVAEIRTPLARAGMMVLVAAGLSSLRWRVSAGSVLAVAALAIELENPRAVVDIGFQLSFSVVAALIYVFPAWSRRIEITGIPRSALVESIRATTTAWLVATPIAAHHFGMMSLLGIPATLVLFPMVAGVLVLGYFRILLCASVFASDLSGHALNVVTSMLWKSVHLLDWIPGSGIDITAPSWAWVCAAECAGLGIMLGRRNTTRIPSGIGLVVLWLLASSF